MTIDNPPDAGAETVLQQGRDALDRLRLPSRAAQAFRQLLELEPQHLEARYSLGKALFQLGEIDAALEAFTLARTCAEAAGLGFVVDLCRRSIAVAIPGSPSASPEAILEARRDAARTWAGPRPSGPDPLAWSGRDRDPERPLVVGYVSSFFDRENWMKPVWGVLNAHDRERFQVRIFSFGPLPGGDKPGSDKASGWRPADSDRVFDVDGASLESVAELMAREEVDVLVDLNGYSDLDRLGLYALRPAPRVVGWFNLYATTGAWCHQALIADPYLVPPGEERGYTERILRVPGTAMAFEVGYPVPDVVDGPCVGGGPIVFGSLASRYKLTPPVLDAWAEILRRTPGTRLLLRNAGCSHEVEQKHLEQGFVRRGVSADRLTLLGRAPHQEFLETYGRIDIALDPFPYNGGTTTSEALWQGVPVVAWAGPTWASRTSTSLLCGAGLHEWVAEDLPGYIQLAVQRATQPGTVEHLRGLRWELRSRIRASATGNPAGLARELEALYRKLWRDWCAGHESRPNPVTA